jgi:hypothetical protein
MKAIIFKAIVVVLLALGATNYFVYLKTGKSPLLDLKTQADGNWLSALWQSLSFDRMADKAKDGIQSIKDGEGSAGVKVHKWTDEYGQVHFGDRAPTGVNATQIKIVAPDSAAQPTKPTEQTKLLEERAKEQQ